MTHYIHNINPIVFKLGGPLAVRWYGLSYLLGFIAAILLLRNWSKKDEFEVPVPEVSNFVVMLAFIGVFIGGRLGYVLLYGFDSFLDYCDADERNWYFGKGWCQIRYMPRMSNYRGSLENIPFDFHELLGVLAPRPFFVSAPLHDSNFRWQSVDRCAESARPIYKLLAGEGNLIVNHPDSDHDFPKDMREEAYKTIDSVLRK